MAPGGMSGCRQIISGVSVGLVAEAKRDAADVFDDAVVACELAIYLTDSLHAKWHDCEH